MKLLDIKGRPVSIQVKYGQYTTDKESRSIFQQKAKEIILLKNPNQIFWEDFVIPGSKMSLDLFCWKLKTAWEMQGSQHSEYSSFFHGERIKNNFAKQVHRDVAKYNWCESNGIKLIEVFNLEDLYAV